ncbi:hypothetical protein [Kutzneria buriramensis]|uniref:Uncharacterized protein n=1 Tax=Kutzneria buriramensis TaxID=1045776 RepID=A0A3E0GVB8_9PSEU|nr:hypothetical protein [Kutzneria buriramensis]REH29677.1 hypothetical protein BCF44_124104 [Kutzneria buriramensis]
MRLATVAAELPTPLTDVHDRELTLRGDFRLADFRFRRADEGDAPGRGSGGVGLVPVSRLRNWCR